MKYIAIDLGTKTMGIAISQGLIATKKETFRFKENNFRSAAHHLQKMIDNEKYDILVIGYPKNMDNSCGERTKMIDNFISIFNKINDKVIKIELVDERLTTKIANNIMIEANLSRKKRKKNKDTLAAQLILDTYLNKIKK